MQIAEKMYVAIDYTLSLDSGEEVDKSEEGRPLAFITGADQIIPGLENALMGRTVGDSAQITVEPEDGYGVVRENLFQEIPKDQFPGDVEITPGMAFEAQGPKGPFMITVSRVNDNETVTVDLNHPMAGKRLMFDITIVEVRQPTTEELASLSDGCACGDAEQQSCGCDDPTEDAGCGSGCNCG